MIQNCNIWNFWRDNWGNKWTNNKSEQAETKIKHNLLQTNGAFLLPGKSQIYPWKILLILIYNNIQSNAFGLLHMKTDCCLKDPLRTNDQKLVVAYSLWHGWYHTRATRTNAPDQGSINSQIVISTRPKNIGPEDTWGHDRRPARVWMVKFLIVPVGQLRSGPLDETVPRQWLKRSHFRAMF